AFARDLGGSLMVTGSRRTGGPCEQVLARALDAPHFLYRWSAGGENPYLGMLGSADAVLVTADSASMCTEACASGAPVFLYRPGSGGKKLARLHRRLEELGHLLPLGAPWPERLPPPLEPAATVAEAIRERLGSAVRLPRLAVARAPASR
ncbi:MAG: ELM1/GtrOC1 family putative glycosyltransferase, partial [Geminicoccaceae bacterium]